ncbi:alpha/beta hydrolase [Brevundimonas vesicularis]|uniref:alpha/beta hydrolase n=1 Tax=Brevundimonas vesicularis TaxID=41276 RepID=UPI0038D495E4
MLSLTAALLFAPVATPVELPGQPAPIHGTLLVPEGETRATAILIAGSGPTDRDGNSPVGVMGSVYKTLAEGLAQHGIATVRYDKRGIAGSQAAGLDEAQLTFDTYIDDAKAWARQTADRQGAPCVWLIGHSEGALIAQAAAADNPQVCGLVLLSPVSTRANVEIRRQLSSQPEAVKAMIEPILSELEAGRTVAEVPPGLAALFRPSVQPYLISYFVVDPQELLKAYDRPVMLGHGSTDIQVIPQHTDTLAALKPEAVKVIFEGLNHVLKPAPQDSTGNAATYGNSAIGLGDEVVPAVAEFILK